MMLVPATRYSQNLRTWGLASQSMASATVEEVLRRKTRNPTRRTATVYVCMLELNENGLQGDVKVAVLIIH